MPKEVSNSLVTQQTINKLSSKPTYQYLLIAFMSMIWLQITYTAMISSYIFMNPLFQCSNTLTTEIQACKDIKMCHIINSFSATYSDGLYCERKSDRTNIQAIFAFGSLVGMFGLPALADVKGRKFSFNFAFILQFFAISGLIVGIYQNNNILMMAGQFLAGIFTSGIVILTYVYTGEVCNDALRQRSMMIYSAFWQSFKLCRGLGQISYFFFYNYLPQWDNHLILVIFIPCIGLMLINFFFLVETPEYFLVMEKNLTKFNESIQKICLYNNISSQSIEELKKSAEVLYKQSIKPQAQHSSTIPSSNIKYVLKQILTNKSYLIPCLCLSLTQFGYNIFYYGIQGSLERTGFNFGLTMLLVGVNEFLTYLIASYFIKKIKRKFSLIISILVTCSIGLLFMQEAVKNSKVLQSAVISLTKIGCVYCYSLICILQVQSFPTQIRSTAVGLSIGMSQVGRIILPYLITTVNDLGIHPIVVSSILFLGFGLIPLFPVKETLISKFKKDNLIGSQLTTNQNVEIE